MTAKTGYTVESSTVTIDSDKTFTASVDTANHYVIANGDGYTLANADNISDYPDLTQVYEISLPEGMTATGTGVILTGSTFYAINGAEVTFDAGTGRAIKPVTIESTDIEITAA